MPRTPAPLTVERFEKRPTGVVVWMVKDLKNSYIAEFCEEADARAFVALPALIEAAVDAIACLRQQDTDDCEAVAQSLQNALAQADGPSPKE